MMERQECLRAMQVLREKEQQATEQSFQMKEELEKNLQERASMTSRMEQLEKENAKLTQENIQARRGKRREREKRGERERPLGAG